MSALANADGQLKAGTRFLSLASSLCVCDLLEGEKAGNLCSRRRRRRRQLREASLEDTFPY